MENKGYIKDLLHRCAAANAHTIAFSLYDGNQITEITYTQFVKDILRATGFFREKNLQKQHIALVAPNSYEWLVTFFAITASGNVAVLLNPGLPKNILQWQCNKADVCMACGDENGITEMQIAGATYDTLKTAEPISMEDVYSFEPEETLSLLFTSGTTGESKAVEITDEIVRYRNDYPSYTVPLSSWERVLLTLPLFHILGLICVIGALQRNGTVCIGRGAGYIFKDMPALNPKYTILVPAMAESLVKIFKQMDSAAERKKYVGTQLQAITLGGASVPPSTCAFLKDQGFIVEIGYGMTETAADGMTCTFDGVHLNTVGKPFGKMQCRIQDGEIQFKGPSVMKGYYKDPAATAQIMEDGWIHTGDMGYCDEDGYYYITGRKKNVIILANGENVNPEEIEAAFSACDAIVECMVYSDGKGICADVYTEDQMESAKFIREYNESMPIFRQVYKVNFSAIPLEKTGSGKIKRKENVYVK